MSDQPPLDPESDLTARAKAFARQILEEMDQPKSPEREAYEARKELEDRESLRHLYRITRQCKATVAEAVSTLVYYLKSLPPEGPFREIGVEIEGLCGRKAVLSLGPVPGNSPLQRYIELTVFTPSGLNPSSRRLVCGANAALAAFLRRELVTAEIGEVAEELGATSEPARRVGSP